MGGLGASASAASDSEVSASGSSSKSAAGDPVGVFFGTNTGSVFASFDAGDSWDEIARHLPTVLSVETMVRA